MTQYVKGVSIYKPGRRNRKTDPYLMAYTDGDGKRRTLTGSTDLRLTIQKATAIGLTLEASQLGIADKHAEKYSRAESKHLNAHIADYEKAIVAKGKTSRYAKETATICRRVIDGAGLTRISELTEHALQIAISEMKPLRRCMDGQSKTDRGTVSLRQKDKAVRALKSFCHWLKQSKRSAVHMAADLSHYDPDQDRRRIRRIVSETEIVRLIETTETRKTLGGLTGPDRAMLYRLAVGTGFRFGTLLSLKPDCFDFRNSPPLILVEANTTKGKKRYEHPLRDDLAAMFYTWMQGKPAHEPIFRVKTHFNETWQKDLAAAGIVYRDGNSFFDFHAQRNQFITAIIRVAGLKVGQDLAHHSTPVLTARYARLSFDDYRKALDGLPSIGTAAGKERKSRTA